MLSLASLALPLSLLSLFLAASGGGVENSPLSSSQKAGPAPAHGIYFSVDATRELADHGALAGLPQSTLGRLYRANVAFFTPGFSGSAIKQVATPEWDLLAGDADHDGVFGEVLGGGIDALGIRRPGGLGPGPVSQRLVLSTRSNWGQAQNDLPEVGLGALDGSLFSLQRAGPGAPPTVRRLLGEQLLLQALGQAGQPGADVDINAFTQDEQGNIYLSFPDTEWVVDRTLADDGVICLPATHLAFDDHGDVWKLDPDSAVIVLDKDRVDALVQAAQVLDPQGDMVTSIGDLQALELDPEGGVFAPVDPVDGLPGGVPNLLFNGQRLGPTVLTTDNGGEIARLNGCPLGASPMSGVPLGLDGQDSAQPNADLQGLLLGPRREPTPMIDVDELGLDVVYGDEQLVFLLGGFAPKGWAWVLASATQPGKGGWLPAVPSQTGVPYPWLLVPQPSVGWPVALDDLGRARIEIPVGGKINGSFLGVLQAYEVGSGRLSAPAASWIF